MAKIIEYRDRIDHKIIFVVASLVVFGLVMIYSVASSQDNLSLFLKQVAIMSFGFVLMVIIQRIKIDRIRPFILLSYIVSYVTIFILLLPEPITVNANGATRWIKVGPVQFQVAEFVKIAVILTLAWWIESLQYRERGVGSEVIYFLCTIAIGGIPAVLLIKISNDLSSAMVIVGITYIISFIGSRGKLGWFLHILLAVAVVIFVVWYVMRIKNNMPTEQMVIDNEVKFRDGRIAAWLAPEKYAKSIGFQPLHCLYAIANGGWVGKGLGQSWQKSILPESENDVIFAIIVEELGILGALLLLFIFVVLITLMCRVAYNTEDIFGRTIIIGIVSHFVLQIIIHCCVCTNTIPNTGIGLPFISSGMTQSLVQMMEMAMVLSIARIYIFDLYHKKKNKGILGNYLYKRRQAKRQARRQEMKEKREELRAHRQSEQKPMRKKTSSGPAHKKNTKVTHINSRR